MKSRSNSELRVNNNPWFVLQRFFCHDLHKKRFGLVHSFARLNWCDRIILYGREDGSVEERKAPLGYDYVWECLLWFRLGEELPVGLLWMVESPLWSSERRLVRRSTRPLPTSWIVGKVLVPILTISEEKWTTLESEVWKMYKAAINSCRRWKEDVHDRSMRVRMTLPPLAGEMVRSSCSLPSLFVLATKQNFYQWCLLCSLTAFLSSIRFFSDDNHWRNNPLYHCFPQWGHRR